jgi:hypothetical protein
VDLECGVEEVPGPPAYIYWYRHDQVLSYQAGHQLSISTAPASNSSLISKLSIKVHVLMLSTSPASNNSLISKLSIKVHLLMPIPKISVKRPNYRICIC